ncbi:MAG: STAS domain-containing protein [Actinobacteria bacterium]|nr:STAS domain-containing protein [Actinomycetota bacterium]
MRIGRGDLVAGVTAAFVLIPQSLAYAQLAGMPPARGLYVAALAPIAAAFFASSPYLGTGPTAITSLLTLGALTAIAAPGSFDYVALAGLLALLVGTMRILLGAFHAGTIVYLLSQPVITGFMTGAAAVIVASQIPDLLYATGSAANPFVAAWNALMQPGSWHLQSLFVGMATVVVVLAGKRIHRLFPGILLAVVGATLYGALGGYTGHTVGEIGGSFPRLSLDLPWASIPLLLIPAMVIAVVGFSEPAAIARHYAAIDRQRWNPNREFVSQGVANLAAAIGGGFPVGGSFTRSAVVHDAGATTRLAGGITGLVVLVMLPFMDLLSSLPVPALAAGVIVAVREMLSLRPFREYWSYARLQFLVAGGTLVATVSFAPHVERGVLVGVALATAAHLLRELRLSIPSWVSDNGTLHLAPKGVLYFASSPGLERTFTELLVAHPDSRKLVIHLDGLGRVDLTGALALRGLLEDARAAGLETTVKDIPPQARKIITRVVLDGDR